MKSTEIQALQQSLLEQKGLILNKTYEFRMEQADRSSHGDEVEVANDSIAEDLSLHLHEKDRRTLYQIERALAKIAAGTYGQCESCGAEIGARRLSVRPFSTLCVSCMEEQETAPRQ